MTKVKIATIDMTPSWSDMVPALKAMLRDGSYAAQEAASQEMARMAALADRYVADQKAALQSNKEG